MREFVLNIGLFQHTAARRRLLKTAAIRLPMTRFNTQPPEGGCADLRETVERYQVSTHSRPKAAVLAQQRHLTQG